MAGIFTHAWIANQVLKKLRRQSFISKYENIDDYFFGSIAPDIRYVSSFNRDVTHKPFNKNSVFAAVKSSSVSMPFLAGYETHLIVDSTWANDNKLMKNSIYKEYNINPNDFAQKFALYFSVDQYFYAEANELEWFFPMTVVGNIARSDDLNFFPALRFSKEEVDLYKKLATGYLVSQSLDTFMNAIPRMQLNKIALKKIVDTIPNLSDFLKDFRTMATEKCIQVLERYS